MGATEGFRAGEGHDLTCVLAVSLWLPDRGQIAGAMLGAGRGWCNCPAGDQGGERWSDSSYIVKVEPKGRGEKGMGARIAPGFLPQGRMDFVFTEMGRHGGSRLGDGNQELRRWASRSGGRRGADWFQRQPPSQVSLVPSHLLAARWVSKELKPGGR